MASLKLLDSGYYTSARTGTPASTKVNSGTAVDLTNTASVRLRSGSNLEQDPQPGSSAPVNTNFVSFENGRFDIDLQLRKDNATDQTILKHLAGVKGSATYPGMAKTDGLKLLYISGVSDTKKTLVELLGQTGTNFHGNEITAGLPCFIGRVENISVTDVPTTNLFSVKLTFIEGEDA